MTTGTSRTVLLTGASSGFGALTVRALARAGHTVHAGIRHTAGRNAPAVDDLRRYAARHDVDLRAVELDVTSQESVDAAVAHVLAAHGRLDVVVHNAGRLATGPAEAFTPEQLAQLYDVNVLGAQRVTRAALPHLREQAEGLLVWIGSSSTRGGCPPFVGPYFAAKAALDALAVSYAAEVLRFGVDTAIVVPGAFPSGTNHFAHAGSPADTTRAAAYDDRYGALLTDLDARLAALVPPDADAADVADAVVRLVAMPAGTRPLRTHVDPSRDGSEVVSAVADRVRADFFRRIGLDDLLTAGSSR
ncbi:MULTISPECIES: SDR family NAD(P)-dependent oxidoreductase [unclassified Streptomyces]|uniref:SDR family NAD(P)-dependent oxidoreductase n=1 Tax=unclassified Streptomyces TaxID=2593676 RepID=UPI001F04DFC5|nr:MULTISPECIES: SDR family NAD(P)-dependent oxidoreductase [unclassified Streptomyces]MCH0564160.1 SDR family NAD(P)-dependent oxidoreductase [Streptomyces sp. MUM 2J]MCH0568463.1 SDR family NAD(P)-dependent oxidoreductase [Streptomyces sp. MUM 136J]